MKSSTGVLHQLPALAEFRFQLRSFLAFSESAAEQHGITPQQYQLLQIVAQAAPQGAPITHIAERLLLRHNSAVELIDRAELATLVKRTEDPADHRRTLVRLTPRGRGLLTRLLRHHIAFLQQSGPHLIGSLQSVLNATAPHEDRAC